LGEYTATATKEYIYLGDTPIAVVQAGNILTIQTDHLDTPRQLTDNIKKVVWNWAYSAFGENQPTNINSTVFNLRYPGQYYDAESKLHYNINRYYDPATGRYTQSDPIGLSGGINTYTYVGGNSIRWSDPWGLLPPSEPGLGTVCIECAFIPVVRLVFSLCNLANSQSVSTTSTAKPSQTTPVNLQQTIARNIHEGQQGKHTPGHNNFRESEGKSIINPNINPQSLLNGYHNGSYTVVGANGRGNPVVNFGNTIGVDKSSGLPTPYGTIHSGKGGAHIVPASPTLYGK
jgi:RHS repeat-associated protein